MLSEQQCNLIETALRESVEPRKVAAYLCFHMGLMLAEAAALRWEDIDLTASTVTLRNVIGRPEGGRKGASTTFQPMPEPRTLPMPPHVWRYLRANEALYADKKAFILTGGTEVPAFHHMQNILTSVCTKYKIADSLSVMDLRSAFIRRCIQSGMDLFSLCAYVGIRQPNVIVKRYGEYFAERLNAVAALERFGGDYVNVNSGEPAGVKRMNLLILGAGSQGPVVKEIAEAIGIFDEIAFLDDDPENRLAIGPLSDIDRLANRYPLALPSFGDGRLRQRYMDACEEKGYIVVGLTHPSATVSPNAKVERSVVIEARSVISSGAVIGRGALVSSASVIGPGARIGAFAHIGASATIEKNAVVEPFARVPAGTVARTNGEMDLIAQRRPPANYTFEDGM